MPATGADGIDGTFVFLGRTRVEGSERQRTEGVVDDCAVQ